MRTFLFDLPVLPDAVLDCREGLTRARKALVCFTSHQGWKAGGEKWKNKLLRDTQVRSFWAYLHIEETQ